MLMQKAYSTWMHGEGGYLGTYLPQEGSARVEMLKEGIDVTPSDK